MKARKSSISALWMSTKKKFGATAGMLPVICGAGFRRSAPAPRAA
jgi:hypothetical protein